MVLWIENNFISEFYRHVRSMDFENDRSDRETYRIKKNINSIMQSSEISCISYEDKTFPISVSIQCFDGSKRNLFTWVEKKHRLSFCLKMSENLFHSVAKKNNVNVNHFRNFVIKYNSSWFRTISFEISNNSLLSSEISFSFFITSSKILLLNGLFRGSKWASSNGCNSPLIFSMSRWISMKLKKKQNSLEINPLKFM